MVNEHISHIKQIIEDADAILITAGAGMGVDSGLPDFRGDEGFWKAYPAIKDLGISFSQMANPKWFINNPKLAWAFYGHRLNLYRDTVPHDGFKILLDLVKQKNDDYFIYTSNVDGEFQKAGFSEEKIVEVHGSIHYFQCLEDCKMDIWDAKDECIVVDMDKFEAKTIPLCKHCGGVARPNIMMFGDWGFNGDRTMEQEDRFSAWYGALKKAGKKLAIIEIGAGTAIPTIRNMGEKIAKKYKNATLIRINPWEERINPKFGLSIALGGLEGLEKIFLMSQYFCQLRSSLKKDTLDDFDKTYFLDATHELKIEKEYSNTPVYIELKILKYKSNVRYRLSLFSWSNKDQKYVAIENSFLKGTKAENFIEDIGLEYTPILLRLRDVLMSIKYADQLKEFIYRIENITYVFHYKLLNMFTQKELEAISTKLNKSLPRINVALLKSEENIYRESDLFLPNYESGFYAHEYGLEISTDLDESDYPTVEYGCGDDNSSLTKQELLKLLEVYTNIQT